jgi:hypothetical protein
MCWAGKPSAGLTLNDAVRYHAGYLGAVSCKWTSQWPSGTVQGRSWSGVSMTAPGGIGPVRPTLMRPEAPWAIVVDTSREGYQYRRAGGGIVADLHADRPVRRALVRVGDNYSSGIRPGSRDGRY